MARRLANDGPSITRVGALSVSHATPSARICPAAEAVPTAEKHALATPAVCAKEDEMFRKPVDCAAEKALLRAPPEYARTWLTCAVPVPAQRMPAAPGPLL